MYLQVDPHHYLHCPSVLCLYLQKKGQRSVKGRHLLVGNILAFHCDYQDILNQIVMRNTKMSTRGYF